MNKIIDYNDYFISSTTAFDEGLAQLKEDNMTAEIKKIFQIIDEIIEDVDMYAAENARPLKSNREVIHVHLSSRRSGDIILLYRVNGQGISLDLRLHNITNHEDMDKKADPKLIDRQKLHDFEVVPNKYSADQIEYAEMCFFDLISDYRFYRTQGDKRAAYTEVYLRDFYDTLECDDPLEFDEFLQIMQYLSTKHKKAIFGSIDLSRGRMRTPAITQREEQYILQLFDEYEIDIDDAYIETEVDEYGDTYESMYVESVSNNFRSTKLLESELYSLEDLFNIHFSRSKNGLGSWGNTYEFSHYFEE